MELNIRNYCAEDDTYVVNGELKRPLDLQQIRAQAQRLDCKVVFMPRLKVIVVIFAKTTVHLHADGRIIVNHATTVEAARALLAKLL